MGEHLANLEVHKDLTPEQVRALADKDAKALGWGGQEEVFRLLAQGELKGTMTKWAPQASAFRLRSRRMPKQMRSAGVMC